MRGMQRQAKLQDFIENAVGDFPLRCPREGNGLAGSQGEHYFVRVRFKTRLGSAHEVADYHVAVLGFQFAAGLFLQILGFGLDTRERLDEVKRVAQSVRFPMGLMSDSSAPGYGRIWRLPVSFTIDRQGRLAEDGWKEKHPVWTQERLDEVVTPLLRAG